MKDLKEEEKKVLAVDFFRKAGQTLPAACARAGISPRSYHGFLKHRGQQGGDARPPRPPAIPMSRLPEPAKEPEKKPEPIPRERREEEIVLGLLVRFEEEKKKGRSDQDAADVIGVPLPIVRSWLRKVEPEKKEKESAPKEKRTVKRRRGYRTRYSPEEKKSIVDAIVRHLGRRDVGISDLCFARGISDQTFRVWYREIYKSAPPPKAISRRRKEERIERKKPAPAAKKKAPWWKRALDVALGALTLWASGRR